MLAGCLLLSAPMLRKSCRAITLLLNLLMSRITSASGRDSWTAMRRASAGATPSRARPRHVPPLASQRGRKTACAYCTGVNRLTCQTLSPHDSGNTPRNCGRIGSAKSPPTRARQSLQAPSAVFTVAGTTMPAIAGSA